jgi:hypothetical protein
VVEGSTRIETPGLRNVNRLFTPMSDVVLLPSEERAGRAEVPDTPG